VLLAKTRTKCDRTSNIIKQDIETLLPASNDTTMAFPVFRHPCIAIPKRFHGTPMKRQAVSGSSPVGKCKLNTGNNRWEHRQVWEKVKTAAKRATSNQKNTKRLFIKTNNKWRNILKPYILHPVTPQRHFQCSDTHAWPFPNVFVACEWKGKPLAVQARSQ
jgi:hypothetical protein